ncbi:MAG: hypothetical protein IJ934_04720 [Acetobacter sp.]|nr:hypothetical protein [Acetobacter sp.]
MTTIDPKEIKILSDILALVLEEHPGQSSTALETLRRRAKRNNTTGGAIKNLFQVLATNPSKAREASSASSRSRNSTRAKQQAASDTDTYRTQLQEMRESISRLDYKLKTVIAQNASLEHELDLTRQSRAELQSRIAGAELALSRKKRLIMTFVFLSGCVTGIVVIACALFIFPMMGHV